MARVFVTGSTDGLGLMAARLLAETGHTVVLHARNAARAADARRSSAGVRSGRSRRPREPFGDARRRRAGQPARPLRRGDPQRRRRPARASGAHHGRAAARLRDQRPRALRPDGPRRAAEAARLPELGHAPWRRPRPRGRRLEEAALGGLRRLFREQAPRRAARFRRGQALAGRAVERSQPGLGGHADGRARGARRHGRRSPHAGLARRERRSGSARDRPVPSPHEAAAAGPGGSRRKRGRTSSSSSAAASPAWRSPTGSRRHACRR